MLDLSDEAWGALSEVLSAHHIAKLWLSGSRMLRQRLSRGIMRFELKYGRCHRFQWPSLISNFHNLHALIIDGIPESGVYNNYYYIENVNLDDISPTVRQISFLFANGLLSLCDLTSISADNQFILQDLKSRFPLLAMLDFKNGYAGQAWFDLEKSLSRFPFVESLQLRTLPGLNLTWLHRLPDSLNALDVGICAYPNTDWSALDAGKIFPPLLTSLHLHSAPCEIITILPSGIRTLYASFLKNTASQKLDLTPLRQYHELTFLSLSEPEFTPEMASALPPNLTHLQMWPTMLYTEALTMLPPKLKTFIWIGGRSRVLRSGLYQDTSQLPAGLEIMPASLFPSSDPSSWIKLPRNLKLLNPLNSLVIAIEAGDKPYFKDLPKNLELLSLDYKTKPGEEFKDFPPRLLRLRLNNCFDLRPLVTHMTSLTTLELAGSGPIDCSPLREIKCPLLNLSIGEQLIPSGLKKLFLIPDSEELSFSCLSESYSGLSRLETLTLPAKFHGGIDDLDDWMSTLPSTLKSLKQTCIGYPKSSTLDFTSIPPNSLLSLPGGLTSLEIYCNGIEWSHIVKLPESLKHMTLSGAHSCIRPSDLHLLPYSLSTIAFPPSEHIPLESNPSNTRQYMETQKLLHDFSKQRRLLLKKPEFPGIFGVFLKEDNTSKIPSISEILAKPLQIGIQKN